MVHALTQSQAHQQNRKASTGYRGTPTTLLIEGWRFIRTSYLLQKF